MPIAITREVSPTIGRCELTHLDRRPIDVALAQAVLATLLRRSSQIGRGAY